MVAPRPFGQHFLIDRHAARRVVAALRPRSGEPVLEIGPGRGALTGGLIRAAGRIAAVEIDRRLADSLRRRFADDRLVLFEGDVLQLQPARVLAALDAPPGARLVVAGNLPYGISKPVAQRLIADRRQIDRAVLMFQREVAQRLTARCGGRRYAPLSVLAGLAFRITKLFDLPPRAFDPPPAVVSTVTHWEPRADDLLSEVGERQLRSVLAVCFARRRRTLRNNLRARFADDSAIERRLDDAGLDGGLRAEAVPPAGFLRLAARWADDPLV
jgi:16S rRNA (adenine1518-N6/adenine1519-N6)-dimethyltransferase